MQPFLVYFCSYFLCVITGRKNLSLEISCGTWLFTVPTIQWILEDFFLIYPLFCSFLNIVPRVWAVFLLGAFEKLFFKISVAWVCVCITCIVCHTSGFILLGIVALNDKIMICNIWLLQPLRAWFRLLKSFAPGIQSASCLVSWALDF